MTRYRSGRSDFMKWGNPGVALVTGASAGLGRSFARILAEQGFDLILVARREDRLQELSRCIRRRYGAAAEVLAADLSCSEDVGNVVEKILGTERLDVVVNNAGFVVAGSFHTATLEKELAMKRVHVDAPVRITGAALPGMVRRGRGVVINVCSLGSFFSVPGGAMYSATKGFLRIFSAAISIELARTGVTVQALCPGLTRTEIHSVGDYREHSFDESIIPEFLWMDADEVVRQSLEAVSRNKVVFIPGLKNRLLRCFLRTWAGKMTAVYKLRKLGRI
jgi:short-subunit dehydrogenase